ncbi:hypothetical protein [Caballeronia grimmiae]|uniref:hypothetical protein n=1 Tax=Caballeronia grimmiae TaxID=1071679 RepID=UPI0038B9F286
MTISSGIPFYGGSSNNTSIVPRDGGNRRLALDNLIRRELKVGDPNDPAQVAQALLARYQADPRAQAINQEAQGLPFLLTQSAPAPVLTAPTSSNAEWQQATSDIESDLAELTTNSLLKDVAPELTGWQQAVRTLLLEGGSAARLALDPRQRDKAFGIRRQLGDYARMARLVGALTGPSINANYRAFAQSLDEAAAVLLVMMGEALSNVGFAGGKYLLQAPYSELQVRRDAAIYALRNLVGATQEAYGANDWPRGLDAYRRLFDVLEAQGQGDLRTLLMETELGRTMDELIQRAQHGSVEGLRALGATAQLDLERLRRLVIIGQRAVRPESPPLTAFLEGLALFADAFDPSGGFRLLRIARPPVLFYGLYGMTTFDDADDRLTQLIIDRGKLAQRLDCFLQCGCAPELVQCQVVLDKILYDLDRAIDLYAVGKEDFGEPERRAAAYSFIISAFKDAATHTCGLYKAGSPNESIGQVLDSIMNDRLRPQLRVSTPDVKTVKDDLLRFASDVHDELTARKLCRPISGGGDLCQTILDEQDAMRKNTRTLNLGSAARLYAYAQFGRDVLEDANVPGLPRPSEFLSAYLGIMSQELNIQLDMESSWANLVKTMAPDCVGITAVLDVLKAIVKGAIGHVGSGRAPSFQVSLPPHFETSLDGIVENVLPDGSNRLAT